jgi:hypothetical protein
MQQPHEEVRWKPSELMRNDTWTSMLESTFKLGDAVQIRVNRNEHDAMRADHLYQLLQHRLTTHIRKRVSDETKHNHWCLQFARHNLPQVCALAVMVGHIKKNIDTARDDTCLLSPHVSNFHKVAPDEGGRTVPGDGSWEQLEGCYLIREEAEELRWIRSGKSAGSNTNIGTRYKEHKKGSLLQQDNPSAFYQAYPSKSTNSTAQARIGWFENLEFFVGIVFDRRDTSAIDYMCRQQDGVFEWRPHVHSALERCPWHQQDMPNKKMNMVAYLLELFYDLCQQHFRKPRI